MNSHLNILNINILDEQIGGFYFSKVELDKIKQNKHHLPLENIQLENGDNSPYKNLENRNSMELIKWIINQLPDLQKLTITMRDVEEYELEEIAAITGSNIAAVKVNLSRARKKVRDSFLNIQNIK